jgi:hypothetical protein
VKRNLDQYAIKKYKIGVSAMIKRLTWITLRVLAVILIGFVSAVIGFIVVVNLGFMIAPEFVLNGREGYEATGPIGFILGALIGLIGSGMLLFRRRGAK